MLQPSEILQIDAAMIAGIFILLTIKSFKFSEPSNHTFWIFTKEQLVAAIILPFSASAIQILSEYALNSTTELKLTWMDLVMPIVGFAYVIIMTFVIAKFTKVET